MISVKFRNDLVKYLDKYKRILFLGIGETRMSDDGFGPYITFKLLQHFENSTPLDTKIINGKIDYIERKSEILDFNPDLLVIFDTCQSNTEKEDPTGEIHLHYEESFVNWLPLSSHVLPIPVFVNELKLTLPNLKSILIGVIPYSTKHKEQIRYSEDDFDINAFESNPDLPFFKFNLSPKIQKVADELLNFLTEILQNRF